MSWDSEVSAWMERGCHSVPGTVPLPLSGKIILCCHRVVTQLLLQMPRKAHQKLLGEKKAEADTTPRYSAF
jgi:hypothetical protein